DPVPRVVPTETPDLLRQAATETGVTLSALSGTCNLTHPDEQVRRAGVSALHGVMDCAAQAGIGLVTLCTGSRDPADMWMAHPDNATPEAWADMRACMAELAEYAQTRGLHLGIEPEQANVVRNVGDALRLATELQTDRLRVVLDPANLFEEGSPDLVRDLVDRALNQALPMLGLVHVKDRSAKGDVVAPGEGAVDFPAFFRRLQAVGYDGALITHGIGLADVAQTAQRMRGWLP
ncbi:MAG TPA: sugar phosphate isomerase/epimerase family protein, partial [Paenirhodobacter sp.]